MRPVVLLPVALLLAGCAAVPTERIVDRSIEVKVPVPVPCVVETVERPVFAVEQLPPDASTFERVRALLIERRQRIAYEAQRDAAIAACQ